MGQKDCPKGKDEKKEEKIISAIRKRKNSSRQSAEKIFLVYTTQA